MNFRVMQAGVDAYFLNHLFHAAYARASPPAALPGGLLSAVATGSLVHNAGNEDLCPEEAGCSDVDVDCQRYSSLKV